jgi:hypothetical protein
MKLWLIVIECAGREAGPEVPCDCWDVLTKLAAYRAALPTGWTAEAYPVVS